MPKTGRLWLGGPLRRSGLWRSPIVRRPGILTLCALLCCVVVLPARAEQLDSVDQSFDVAADASILLSSDQQPPLWLTANRYGRFQQEDAQIAGGLAASYERSIGRHFGVFGAVSVQGTGSSNSELFLREGYAGLRGGPLLLHAGWYPLTLGELPIPELGSGSMAFSSNARPIPRLTLRTDDFISIPYLNPVVQTKFGISHGEFFDERYVEQPLLHEKWLYLRFSRENVFSIHGGLVHFAMWGGDNPDGRAYEETLDKYMDVFFGRGWEFERDSLTASADMMGIWDIGFSVSIGDAEFSGYHHHFFEDRSGFYRLQNGRDGLSGISLSLPQYAPLIPDRLLFEHVRTTSQSGPYHDLGAFGAPEVGLQGQDHYYDHYVYRSGWTHYGRIVGTPLFLVNSQGEDTRIRSNRIVAAHYGLAGPIVEGWRYRILYTTVGHRDARRYIYDDELAEAISSPKRQYDLYFEVSAEDPFALGGVTTSVGVGATFGDLEELATGVLLEVGIDLY